MKSVKNIILLLLFPITLLGQNDHDSKKKLEEINSYVQYIDSISKNSKEGIIEGPIIYKTYLEKMVVGKLIS